MSCCETFEKAQEEGTDNEMYSALLWFRDGAWRMGHDFTISWCPWCGAKLSR